jgi:hypothetical protein
MLAMSVFEQHVRGFWTQGGRHALAMLPIGWIVVAMAFRSGFSRRSLKTRWPCAAAFAALAAGLVSEQLLRRSARELIAETGGKASADLLAAIEVGALAPRLLGVAICVFALIVVAFGLAQRRLGAAPTVPPVCVRWRLAASTALLFLAAYLATANVADLGVAVVSLDSDGVVPGVVSAAIRILVACGIGAIATAIRDGGVNPAVAREPTAESPG